MCPLTYWLMYYVYFVLWVTFHLQQLEKLVSGWKMSEQEKKALYSDLWNTYQHSASKRWLL